MQDLSLNSPENPDINLREQELALREREVKAKENEVALRVKELQSRWRSPVFVALSAATLAILGNIYSSHVNSANSDRLEHMRIQGNIVLEAIKTNNDKKATCDNLRFFLYLKLLEDIDDAVKNVCKAEFASSAVPGVPSMGAQRNASRTLVVKRTLDGKPVKGDLVVITYSNHFVTRCQTNKQGECSMGDLSLASNVAIRVEIKDTDGQLWKPDMSFFRVPYSGEYIIAMESE